MFEFIKKGAKLSDENRPLLWIEVGLFSVLSGIVCHSGVAFILIVFVLAWLMTRSNGMFYMIFAISALWSILPFCWGLADGGWPWAFSVGVIAFWMGIKIHVNGLKWQWDEVVYKSDDTIEWKRFSWSGPNAIRTRI